MAKNDITVSRIIKAANIPGLSLGQSDGAFVAEMRGKTRVIWEGDINGLNTRQWVERLFGFVADVLNGRA